MFLLAQSQVKIRAFWTTALQRFTPISSHAAVMLLLPEF